MSLLRQSTGFVERQEWEGESHSRLYRDGVERIILRCCDQTPLSSVYPIGMQDAAIYGLEIHLPLLRIANTFEYIGSNISTFDTDHCSQLVFVDVSMQLCVCKDFKMDPSLVDGGNCSIG